MPTAKKRPYTKRQKAYWARKRTADTATGKVAPPPESFGIHGKAPTVPPKFSIAEAAANLRCAFCSAKPHVVLSLLGRGKSVQLCEEDLKRLVNGEALL